MIPFQHEDRTNPVDELLVSWLSSKYGQSSSKQTEHIYGVTLARFRDYLQRNGLDLDSAPDALVPHIQAWISTPRKKKHAELSGATRKQRLAIISSFYGYAIKQGKLKINPVDRIDYPKVQDYSGAEPIDQRTIERLLKDIDQSEDVGKRDFALLLVAFTTGRRATELVKMSLGDLQDAGSVLIVRWPRTKGDKKNTDTLEPVISRVLRQWLIHWYGVNWHAEAPTAPVWPRLQGDATQRGTRLSYFGIRQAFIRRLGPHFSKVHASRHSFSLYILLKKGSVLELMERLGHSSLNTTYRYSRHVLEGRQAERTTISDLIGFDEENS